jgi:hypothetical protein
LNLSSLADACLLELFQQLNDSNVVETLEFACVHQLTLLQEVAIDHIVRNAKSFSTPETVFQQLIRFVDTFDKLTRLLTDQQQQVPPPPPPSSVTLPTVARRPLEQEMLQLLRETPQRCDVTLMLGNERLRCHRVILMNCTKYFRTALISAERKRVVQVE